MEMLNQLVLQIEERKMLLQREYSAFEDSQTIVLKNSTAPLQHLTACMSSTHVHHHSHLCVHCLYCKTVKQVDQRIRKLKHQTFKFERAFQKIRKSWSPLPPPLSARSTCSTNSTNLESDVITEMLSLHRLDLSLAVRDYIASVF